LARASDMHPEPVQSSRMFSFFDAVSFKIFDFMSSISLYVHSSVSHLKYLGLIYDNRIRRESLPGY
jgi:hypothetical protein